MTKTTSHLAAACFALLLTFATFQQAIAVPATPTNPVAPLALA